MLSKQFIQQKQDFSFVKEEETKEKKKLNLWGVMDSPELSLGPVQFSAAVKNTNSRSSESEANPRRKRKYWDHLNSDHSVTQTDVELQLKDPLPLDWEQCLDLESGRMYYLNRETLKKSWTWPKEAKIDLELNISTLSSPDTKASSELEDSRKLSNSSSNMVAVACLKCHLLVMLCKSSPSCPNCKYLHSLPTQQSPSPKVAPPKSLETLSLLN